MRPSLREYTVPKLIFTYLWAMGTALMLGSFLSACTPPPRSTSSTGTQQTEASGGISQEAADKLPRAIHDEVNRIREQHGLTPLSWDATLAEVARLHSTDMATHDYFSHLSTTGLDPNDRAARHDFECKKHVGTTTYTGIGENLFMTGLYSRWHATSTSAGTTKTYDWKSLEDLARETVQEWMNSPGHRVNLLNPNYNSEGLGIGISDEFDVYVTEDFC